MSLIHSIRHAVHSYNQHIRIIPALIQSRKLIHYDSLVVLCCYASCISTFPGNRTRIPIGTNLKCYIIQDSPRVSHFISPVMRLSLTPLTYRKEYIFLRSEFFKTLLYLCVRSESIFLTTMIHKTDYILALT